ncbi:MAG TPA: glycerophosphodiester phosphodiesterase family protein [bacterium]|nr:glycerophosphodiester phosphodiesterase family protein [bacterium]HPR87271.1 glycerophosphodiester phosphodiesterase family protein [bacterium]
MKDSFFIAGRPLLLAHRGASGHAPELTMAAFRSAETMQADGCELDVQLSADAHIAVFHDDTLSRTTGQPGALANRRWSELQELDAGGWFAPPFAGERIPDLEQILGAGPADWRLDIELKKTLTPQRLAERVAEEIRQEKRPGRLIFTSFDRETLEHLAVQLPGVRLGLIFAGDWPADHELERWPVWSVEQHLVTRERLQQARARRIKVCVWTVNTVAAMLHQFALGVDAIITNYPDRYHQAREIFSTGMQNSLDLMEKNI